VRSLIAWTLVAALFLAACSADGSSKPSPEASLEAVLVTGAEGGEAGRPTITAAERAIELKRLVALGDAYTAGFGTAAPRRDSWPSQLAEALKRGDVRLWVTNLATSGYTSSQVLDEQLGQVAAYEPDVVTLQVGANDILTGETEWYRENVSVILDELLLILPPEQIFAITTPDHTLTAWGDAYGPREIGSAAVAELNGTLSDVAGERGIEVIDIGLVNELVATDSSLVVKAVPPVPYPTAKQYAGWVEVIGPHIHGALSADEP